MFKLTYEGDVESFLVIKINHSKGERFNENKFYKVVENDGRLEIQ